ncbi:hypothetical protein DQW50_12730 [Halorubrum sp. 48-1-W]|nr:hypothetical protein DQW50_12730 [Halorubrum sp. 48-1-W]
MVWYDEIDANLPLTTPFGRDREVNVWALENGSSSITSLRVHDSNSTTPWPTPPRSGWPPAGSPRSTSRRGVEHVRTPSREADAPGTR